MNYKIGTVFQRKDCTPPVKLVGIQHETVGSTGRKTKLKDPILYFDYLGEDRPQIRMYQYDLERLIHFERWKPE